MNARAASLALVLLAGPPPPVTTAQEPAAQRPDPKRPQGENLATPPTWKVRLDTPDPSVKIGSQQEEADIWFVNMTPGWHVTTGPAAILWHPASTARGQFRASTTIHLFDPGERLEGYGLLLGGRDLAGDGAAYVAFLLRNDGSFALSPAGAVPQWRPHEAIVRLAAGAQGSVENSLAFVAQDDTIRLYVNETEVASLPRSEIHTDGIVGLRVGAELNVHVSELAVTQRN